MIAVLLTGRRIDIKVEIWIRYGGRWNVCRWLIGCAFIKTIVCTNEFIVT